jgi:hypothetical protein
MLELYVLIALSSIGYAFKKFNIQQKPSIVKQVVPQARKPSMKSLHESTRYTDIRKMEAETMAKQFAMEKPDRQEHAEPVANNILKDDRDFTHNNMHHFGSTNQPMNLDTSLPIFEQFTGISDTGYKSKREQSSFFELSRDLGNIGGMDPTYDIQRDRLENSLHMQTNVLPFDQIRVGPGINNGFSERPMDKLSQELEMRKHIMPKNIDDLRATNNPKTQYTGRVIESGMKEIKRAEPVAMRKNRPETTVKLSHDHVFKTTGAFLKPAPDAEINAKHTNRNETEEGYTGNPASKGTKIQDKGSIRLSDRTSSSFGIANAFLGKRSTDFGKSSIQVYSNNRDTTSVSTYKGGLTSLIKAAIAPITDIIKVTKKEVYVSNPRTFGQMQANIPEKGPIRNTNGLKTTIKETTLNDTPNMNMYSKVPKITVNSNDVARVTIKETTLHPSTSANMRGPVCLTVYDPDDIARVTMKQTTLQSSENINMKSNTFKGTVYDDQDTVRTTVKETTLNEAERMNMSANTFKGTVYDDEDTMRTTVKETTLNESEYMNMNPGTRKGVVYDSDDTSRTTVKETTLNDSDLLNVSNHVFKGRVYDPNDTARVTMKETTMSEGELSNMRANVFKGKAYNPSDVARTTIKETMLDYEAPTYIKTSETRGRVVDEDVIAKTTGRETLQEPDTNRVTRRNVNVGHLFDADAQKMPTTMKETTLGRSVNANPKMVYESMPGGYADATMNDKETGREDYGDSEHYGTGSVAANGDGYKVANFEAKETNKETTTDQYFGSGKGGDNKQMSYADIYNATINELRQETLVNRIPTSSGQKVTYCKEDVNVGVSKETIDYDITDFFENIRKPTVSDRDMLPIDTHDMYVEKDNVIDTSILTQLKDNPYMNPTDI